MSGPVDDQDGVARGLKSLAIEVREGRPAEVGGMGIRRVLPTKGRRTVGPWCFVDLMSPANIANPDPMEVGPHPHIGLSTVTWLFEGEALHTDSLGSEQVIRPGELNLMTAGNGIAHAELEVRAGSSDARAGYVKGAQMWLAQPDSTRHGSSGFVHHKDLPRTDLGMGEAQVLIGALAGATSPVDADWPTVGADLKISGPVEVAVESEFEHAIAPIDRRIKVDDVIVEPGELGLIPPGFESLRFEADGGPGRFMLIGGIPFPVRIQMWWNFVARTREELTQAWRDWDGHNDDRFAPVQSSLQRIDAPTPLWVGRD
jgi:redox-sensitive bicupin YhaK (pirin superfamily)